MFMANLHLIARRTGSHAVKAIRSSMAVEWSNFLTPDGSQQAPPHPGKTRRFCSDSSLTALQQTAADESTNTRRKLL